MKAFIDCFKGALALIHLDDGKTSLEIPRHLLPEGADAGSWLNITITLDPHGAKREEEKILKKLEQLKLQK